MNVGTPRAFTLGGARSDFQLRRLHSLFGLVPVGVFLCFHLVVNATMLAGPQGYQAAVGAIHSLSVLGLLLPVEAAFIFLPLGFHAVLGVAIILNGSVNVASYPHGGNVRYLLQRLTGAVALLFLLFHLWQMHWLGGPLGGALFVAEDPSVPLSAAVTASAALRSWPLSAAVYLVGVVASVFHLANGAWTALITWGLTIGPRSQRVSGYVCAALGGALGLLGLAALLAFLRYPA